LLKQKGDLLERVDWATILVPSVASALCLVGVAWTLCRRSKGLPLSL
jgi:hypothetical protein